MICLVSLLVFLLSACNQKPTEPPPVHNVMTDYVATRVDDMKKAEDVAKEANQKVDATNQQLQSADGN